MLNIVNDIEYKFDEKDVIDYISYLNQALKNEKLFSLVFLTTDDMQSINFEFRKLDKPTDVLSFPDDSEEYIGDILICPDILQKQAVEYGHSERRELLFLITHGFLHLHGYDHETYDEEEEMFSLQKQLLTDYKVI